jgi:methylamine--corrinoid protein Co-methyltransferase
VIGTVCGLNQHGVGATAGNETDHTSGLEARFQAEVAHAALGLKRADANEIVPACLSHYEHSLAAPNLGKPFPELYDTETLEPGQEWLRSTTKWDELKTLGLTLILLEKARRKLRTIA